VKLGVLESRPDHPGTHIVEAVPLPRNGFVDTPTGPGFGMNLSPGGQRIRPSMARPISLRPHFDLSARRCHLDAAADQRMSDRAGSDCAKRDHIDAGQQP